MLDLIIRGGTVVDGTGSSARQADIGVKDGLIAEIADHIDTNAERVVEANGLIVACLLYTSDAADE